ncbi:hypothetical protein LX77_02772 [Gelidibacter algens]|uniref:Uncharacterized protein n=1 Tax=Gelidibacter algens TaxID=49280 RepID=A0A1A7R950_9FLAO|nr:hypothetical protein [Gelidibacter algens]OBX27247.1 hypothetical protein A9996_00550 [Gelidibacter algens]RAJ22113.1 hypothetical protein LX77_02772 [Gelidibacter algens]
MNLSHKKGLKPCVMNYLALLIGLCYLANPLHHEISSVFHEISHVAKAPSGLIGHDSVSEQEGITHSYHEHDLSLKEHTHVAIDLYESLFNTSDDHDSDNETVPSIDKLDKHITTHAYTSPQILMTFFRGEYNPLIKKVTAGYLNMSKQPPQFS